MMHKSTVAGLLTGLVSLASCDFITLNWDDVPVSNEASCGSVTINTFPAGVATGAPFKGVFFQNEVIVYNTTVTAACPKPKGLGFATSGTNVATNQAFIVQIDDSKAEFANSLSFDFSYTIPDDVKNKVFDGATFQLSPDLTDFGGDMKVSYKYSVAGDGPGPHHVAINNISGPYLWVSFEGIIWNPSSAPLEFPSAVNVNIFFDSLVFETIPKTTKA